MATTATTVLIIEDEPTMRRFLRTSLIANGYAVVEAATAREGVAQAAGRNPELILLDLGLPDGDGLDVARRIRERQATPIVVLSARGREQDKVAALDLGADDYLTKPFGTGELLARIRALLRRVEAADDRPLSYAFDGVSIDIANHRVTREGDDVHLTRTEWSLLEALSAHAGKLLTHRWLLQQVWGDTYGDDVEVLRVFVSQLRHKIEPDPRRPRAIVTEPGIGYRWSLRPES